MRLLLLAFTLAIAGVLPAYAGPFSFEPINILMPTGGAARLSTVTYDVSDVGTKTFELPDPYATLPLTHDAGPVKFTTEDSGIVDINFAGQTLPLQKYLDDNGAWYVNDWDLTSVIAVSTDGLAVIGLGKPHGQQWYGSQFTFLATYALTYAVPEPSGWILGLITVASFGLMAGGAALNLKRKQAHGKHR